MKEYDNDFAPGFRAPRMKKEKRPDDHDGMTASSIRLKIIVPEIVTSAVVLLLCVGQLIIAIAFVCTFPRAAIENTKSLIYTYNHEMEFVLLMSGYFIIGESACAILFYGLFFVLLVFKTYLVAFKQRVDRRFVCLGITHFLFMAASFVDFGFVASYVYLYKNDILKALIGLSGARMGISLGLFILIMAKGYDLPSCCQYDQKLEV
ncbi:hypothetical protein ADEAN_000833700 [Angomonas deanei]|uniref:Uncharacterized protein n=1 Tax=Angomonas deanei TaxID=59799 RepID=A0A7G2CPD5_9TRYP|nr:hypothetical protein ADEAN_000833700 [Angomonas deanei]